MRTATHYSGQEILSLEGVQPSSATDSGCQPYLNWRADGASPLVTVTTTGAGTAILISYG